MRILVIDDSPVARAIISDILRKIPFVTSVDTAKNGEDGLTSLKNHHYDLIFLDVEMPVMDGLNFLKKKKESGLDIPVVMLSAYTKRGAEVTMKALELGAMDFIPKPDSMQYSTKELEEELLHKVENFHQNRIPAGTIKIQKSLLEKSEKLLTNYEVVLIGASTGGPKVIFKIMKKLPKDFPLPVVIVQHMPEFFTATFAQRLDTESPLEVFEAEENKEVSPGKAVVARGNKHLLLERKKFRSFVCHLSDEEKYNAHRPSIDKTLLNLIEITDGKVISVILTGMGKDGLEGCRELQKKNGFVIAQDEESSVIFGMNRKVIEEGYADVVLDDEKIADYLLKMLEI